MTITLGMIGRLDALNPLSLLCLRDLLFLLHFAHISASVSGCVPNQLMVLTDFAHLFIELSLMLIGLCISHLMSTCGDVVVNNTMNLWSTLNIICKGIFLVCMEACNAHTKLKNSL